jgi:hypothetical protein
MFALSRRLVAALLSRLKEFRPPEDPFADPDAAVREPRRGSPAGRSSAVALAEPELRQRVGAIGTNGLRSRHTDPYDG